MSARNGKVVNRYTVGTYEFVAYHPRQHGGGYKEDEMLFDIILDGQPTGRAATSLEMALLTAIALRQGDSNLHSARYAARVLGVPAPEWGDWRMTTTHPVARCPPLLDIRDMPLTCSQYQRLLVVARRFCERHSVRVLRDESPAEVLVWRTSLNPAYGRVDHQARRLRRLWRRCINRVVNK